MNRRTVLTTMATAGTVTLAGCGSVAGETTLSEPTLITQSNSRRSLSFTEDGAEIANFGADGTVTDGRIHIDTELSHSSDTAVESLSLRLAMPDGDSAPEVAVISPVEGDSSPPPELTLSTPADRPGTRIEVTDLDDLADETISTLGFLIIPPVNATTLTIDCTMRLTESGVLGSDYTLDGEFELRFPEFGT